MKRFIIISGAIIIALSWGAGNTFGEPHSPQPTAKVPEKVDLPVDITIDIIKSGEDIPQSTQIKIDMENQKSGKEIHLILPRRGGNEDHRGPNEHSVVTSTPAQTGVHEPGSRPVEIDLPNPGHSGNPAADVHDLEVPGDVAPDMETPVATPPDFDTPVADVPEADNISGGMVPDMETPVATPPHMDTPAATVPDPEVPGRGISNPHTSRH
ncbi:MAG: hypothetical protein HZA12_05280 [Nitrospirae bacterium]|nr:hypothetical protein [Nitrospirota bacterium]